MNAAAECHDLDSTSAFLGFAPQHLFYLVENSDDLYTRIEIPKKSNTDELRPIDIPYSELKGVQRTINREILQSYPVREFVYSYVKRKSIVKAATELSGGKALLKVDIERFFPSITWKRVFGLYIKLGFSEKAAFILTKLSCKDDCLAQGAPTSPTISNLIMSNLDHQMSKLANTWDMKYLRYSDDMFFYKSKNFNHPKLLRYIDLITQQNGFTLNENKTKFHPKGRPRISLGLLTHGEKPQLPGKARKSYRAAFYRASKDFHWAYENESKLKGMLEWYKCVNGKDDIFHQYATIHRNISTLKIHSSYKSQ